ncbi:hypothetical protein [Pseudonocardia sp. TRM90224]|uniref:hypothetical protein n=1 Tax=Pseudonocardia sp. TRM90224 TaxID=2812678 RepID=UPI001E4AA34E|nr:hypothetical protein [Pseudonocardia sp. TRM90224]
MYTQEFVGDAVGSLFEFFQTWEKGELHRFSVIRDDESDWVECTFALDAHPEVEFSYRWAVASADEPQMGASTSVSVFLSSMVERIRTRRLELVGGKVSLN